jgi:hypothetical protein
MLKMEFGEREKREVFVGDIATKNQATSLRPLFAWLGTLFNIAKLFTLTVQSDPVNHIKRLKTALA